MDAIREAITNFFGHRLFEGGQIDTGKVDRHQKIINGAAVLKLPFNWYQFPKVIFLYCIVACIHFSKCL